MALGCFQKGGDLLRQLIAVRWDLRLLLKILRDLFHLGFLFYMERTPGLTVAALDAGISFVALGLLKLFIEK